MVQSDEVGFSPKAGDLIFTFTPVLKSVLSVLYQRFADPSAQTAPLGFDHVAIALSDRLVIEAVPEDKKGQGKRADHFELPHSVEISPCCGVELRAGVRIAPLFDLVGPRSCRKHLFRVLRAPAEQVANMDRLNTKEPALLERFGSRYSVDSLQGIAREKLPSSVVDWIGRCLKLTSIPNDIATDLDITDELKAQAAEAQIDDILPEVARTYFCSELAVECLKIASACPDDVSPELATPTGLYGALIATGWIDVTDERYVEADVKQAFDQEKTEHEQRYLFSLGVMAMDAMFQRDQVHIDVTDAFLGRFNRMLDEIDDKLSKQK